MCLHEQIHDLLSQSHLTDPKGTVMYGIIADKLS